MYFTPPTRFVNGIFYFVLKYRCARPYDDVFRTLLNDCSTLIIPVINEVFGEDYSGEEKIIFSPNEHFLNQQNGEENERVTVLEYCTKV